MLLLEHLHFENLVDVKFLISMNSARKLKKAPLPVKVFFITVKIMLYKPHQTLHIYKIFLQSVKKLLYQVTLC